MLRRLVFFVVLIDVGLVVARLLTYTAVFKVPGVSVTFGMLAVTFVAAAIFMIAASYSNMLRGSLAFATVAGSVGGAVLIAHMALENFGARVGVDWRLTIAVMLGTFALWSSSGWRSFRSHSTLMAGAAAGCWTALVSVILAVTFGVIGMYFDMPSAAYVATWPEYIQSGSSDPEAFAIANTLDAATSHVATALILGSILGWAWQRFNMKPARLRSWRASGSRSSESARGGFLEMRKRRKPETSEERSQRLKREAQRKTDDAAAESAVDLMIKRNIRLYGP
jgi:hypothetical protein